MANVDEKASSELISDVAPAEELLSDSDLDDAIAEGDPDFLKEMNHLAADKELTIAEIKFSSAMEAFHEEKKKWEEGSRVSKAILRVFPFIIYFSLAFKKVLSWGRFFAVSMAIRAKNLIHSLGHYSKIFFKDILLAALKNFKAWLQAGIEKFGYFPLKKKLGIVFSLLLFGLTGAIFYRSFTHGILPKKFEIFEPNLEKFATHVSFYEPETETEPFYENLRIAIHTVLLPKFYVNLKPSIKSGANPMGAFEFFVEGMSPEVVVEAKDREVEVRDRISRTLEGFTFEQVEDMDGKKRLCDKIKQELNVLLTTGKIKEVYIKNIIIKP